MGRTKGSKNLTSRHVKTSILAVFEDLGGVPAMVRWAKRNRTEFYKIYARLIPTEFRGKIEVQDASELSNDDLLAIIRTGSSRAIGEEAGESITPQVH